MEREKGTELADLIHLLEDDLESKRRETMERKKVMERLMREKDEEIKLLLYEIESKKIERRRRKRSQRDRLQRST